jgi:membrane protein YqaA with SNARE-associated domain
MTRWFLSTFSFFFSWWGAFLLAALDSSPLFVVPFGVDALVIFLAARHRDFFWVYPLIMTAGSLVGAAATYWIGRNAGDAGLSRLVSARHLDRMKRRLQKAGAGTMAAAAVMPPPFPLTPFVLTCGALDVDRWQFFVVFGAMRLIRFGLEATLARWYGQRVLNVLESDAFQTAVGILMIVAIAGAVVSAIVLWRRTRPEPRRVRAR